MKGSIIRKAVSALLSASLLCLSAGAECRATVIAAAKAAGGGAGALVRIPAIMPGASPAMFQPGGFPAGGASLSAALPASAPGSLLAVPKPLPWSSAAEAVPQAPGTLPVLAAPAWTGPVETEAVAAQPVLRVSAEVSGISQDIAPQVEAVRRDELSTEGSGAAAEGVFQRLLGRRQLSAAPADAEPLPDPTLKRLNPKIAVTPVSEHLHGVFFVKFLRGTTLETMLGVLAMNGVKPEVYADNGDGFRVRVALPEAEAARAAGSLAAAAAVQLAREQPEEYGPAAGFERVTQATIAQYVTKPAYADYVSRRCSRRTQGAPFRGWKTIILTIWRPELETISRREEGAWRAM